MIFRLKYTSRFHASVFFRQKSPSCLLIAQRFWLICLPIVTLQKDLESSDKESSEHLAANRGISSPDMQSDDDKTGLYTKGS